MPEIQIRPWGLECGFGPLFPHPNENNFVAFAIILPLKSPPGFCRLRSHLGETTPAKQALIFCVTTGYQACLSIRECSKKQMRSSWRLFRNLAPEEKHKPLRKNHRHFKKPKNTILGA
jgi:hypothetical protein